MESDDATQDRDPHGLDPIADALHDLYMAEGDEINRTVQARLHHLLMDSISFDRSGQHSAQEVEHYLKRALAIVLADLETLANAYPPAFWLWGLRRMPRQAYGNDHLHRRDAARLILIAAAHSTNKAFFSSPDIGFADEPSTVLAMRQLLEFCASGRVLAQTCNQLVQVGIGDPFTFPTDNALPKRVENAEVIMSGTALDVYNQRVRSEHGRDDLGTLLRLGTRLRRLDPADNGPHALMLWYPMSTDEPLVGELSNESFLVTFTPITLSMQEWWTLTHDPELSPDEAWWRRGGSDQAAAGTVLLLRLVQQLVHEGQQGIQLLAALHACGYLPIERDTFIARAARHLATQVPIVENLLPQTSVPTTCEQMLEVLDQLIGEVWPTRAGPITYNNGGQILIDIVAASDRMEDLFEYRDIQAGMDKRRSAHFELVVQQFIDDSGSDRWRPPEKTRMLRGKELKHSEWPKGNGVITDLDAVATCGGIIVFIDCKSSVYATTYIQGGTDATSYTVSENLRQKLIAWQRKVEWIANHRRGTNYDFNDYTTFIPVVCIPQPLILYGDEMNRNLEEQPALRAVSTLREIIDWCSAVPNLKP